MATGLMKFKSKLLLHCSRSVFKNQLNASGSVRLRHSGMEEKSFTSPFHYLQRKALRPDDYEPVREPFDYFENRLHRFMRGMVFSLDSGHKFDSQSKILSVEGPPFSNKTALTKKIAEEFDFRYFADVRDDDYLICYNDFDLREFNDKLEDNIKFYDYEMFLKDGNRFNAAWTLRNNFYMRVVKHARLMAHFHNTGQGCVQDVSMFSDFVINETMLREGFISKETYYVMDNFHEIYLTMCWPPHLIIYMDISAEDVLEKIKATNDPILINAPWHQPEVLETMIKIYREEFINEVKMRSHVLIFDHNTDLDDIIYEIERVNLRHMPENFFWDRSWDNDHLQVMFHRRYLFTELERKFVGPIMEEHEISPELFVDTSMGLNRAHMVKDHPAFRNHIFDVDKHSKWQIAMSPLVRGKERKRYHLDQYLPAWLLKGEDKSF